MDTIVLSLGYVEAACYQGCFRANVVRQDYISTKVFRLFQEEDVSFMRGLIKSVIVVLFASVLLVTVQAQETQEAGTEETKAKVVKTDGTGDSKVKVSNLDFYDSGYGLPGADKTIRASVDFKNTSAEELKDVTVKINLVDQAGQTIKYWETKVPKLAAGAIGSVQEDALYYNVFYFNVQPKIEVQYTEPPAKKEDGQ